MLMVIFGAGASYDSYPDRPPEHYGRHTNVFRPPLANELFLDIPEFRAISKRFDRCQPLIPYLAAKTNVEEILEQFRGETERNEERRRQLLAIEYYIRDLIQTCQIKWLAATHGVTNYRTFLDQVRVFPEICFVTFNYDTLLEEALAGIDVHFRRIRDYASVHNLMVFKLHGSIDWKRWWAVEDNPLGNNSAQPDDAELIRLAPRLPSSTPMKKNGENAPPSTYYPYWHLPALAIPTLSKSSFICPDEHVGRLRECVTQVDKIVIVGWRAGEKQFLDILAQGLKPVDIIAACGAEEYATSTLNNLVDAGVRIRSRNATPYGFTDFVLNRGVDWLRT